MQLCADDDEAQIDRSVRTSAEPSRLPALMTADHINNTHNTHDDEGGDDDVYNGGLCVCVSDTKNMSSRVQVIFSCL